MMVGGVTQSALVVGLDAETLAGVRPAMRQLGLEEETQPLAAAAVRRLDEDRFDIVVCRYPLPDMLMREFAAAVFNGGSSRGPSMLVLTNSDMRSEVGRAVTGGPYLVRSITDPLPVLSESLGHLLRLARRRPLRLPISLDLEHGAEVTGRTVNISLAGALVDGVPLVPVGSQCSFRLALPGAEVTGSAEVVRHSHLRRERVEGIALRWLDLTRRCRRLLDTGLEA
jgi:hypothetical protein